MDFVLLWYDLICNKGYKSVCLKNKFLAFNVLSHTKAVTNKLQKYTVLYFLFEEQALNRFVKVISTKNSFSSYLIKNQINSYFRQEIEYLENQCAKQLPDCAYTQVHRQIVVDKQGQKVVHKNVSQD